MHNIFKIVTRKLSYIYIYIHKFYKTKSADGLNKSFEYQIVCRFIAKHNRTLNQNGIDNTIFRQLYTDGIPSRTFFGGKTCSIATVYL